MQARESETLTKHSENKIRASFEWAKKNVDAVELRNAEAKYRINLAQAKVYVAEAIARCSAGLAANIIPTTVSVSQKVSWMRMNLDRRLVMPNKLHFNQKSLLLKAKSLLVNLKFWFLHTLLKTKRKLMSPLFVLSRSKAAVTRPRLKLSQVRCSIKTNQIQGE